MSTLRGYKWTRPDGTSWHDPTFGGYAVGATLQVPHAKKGDACGVGLHFSPTPEHAIAFGRFPGALWRVESNGPILGQDAQKWRVGSLRVVESIDKPAWVVATEAVLVEIAGVPWLKPQGEHDPAWRHYPTRAAARDAVCAAARDAVWAAARAAAWDAALDAAWNAALRACLAVVSDLSYPGKDVHEAHVAARWAVWKRGYGLLCDVNGVLYTYEKIA